MHDIPNLNTINPSDWTNIRTKNMIAGREGLRFPTAQDKKNYQKLAGWKNYVEADEIRNEKLDQVLGKVGAWEESAEGHPHYEHQEERERHGENRYQHREERERQAERLRQSQQGRVWSTTQDIRSQEEESDNTSECSTEEVIINWDALGYQDMINKELPLYPSDYEDEDYLPSDSEEEAKIGRKRKFEDMNMTEDSEEEEEPEFEGGDSKIANFPMKKRPMMQKEEKKAKEAEKLAVEKLGVEKTLAKKKKMMKVEKVNSKAEKRKNKGKGDGNNRDRFTTKSDIIRLCK